MVLNEPAISNNGVLRPTYIEVNLTRLTENYRTIKQATLVCYPVFCFPVEAL